MACGHRRHAVKECDGARGGIEPPTLRFSVALQRGITIWSRSKIFLEVFFSKTPASPEQPAAERHPRTQRINCARPDAQRTGDGVDGKSIYFNALTKRVCTECTRPFHFSLLFVRAQGVDFCRQSCAAMADRRPVDPNARSTANGYPSVRFPALPRLGSGVCFSTGFWPLHSVCD